MENNFLGLVLNQFEIKESRIKELSPLVLAYIGDAVYEVFIRTMLIDKFDMPVHKLHRHATSFVKASSQCTILHKIMNSLTIEEKEIVIRGRNAKSGTIPKNASIIEYKYATGFEALIGYLYLKVDLDRLLEILKIGTKEEKEENKHGTL